MVSVLRKVDSYVLEKVAYQLYHINCYCVSVMRFDATRSTWIFVVVGICFRQWWPTVSMAAVWTSNWTYFFYASTANIIIYFNVVLSMCMIYFIILTVMGIAPLVDHLIQKRRRRAQHWTGFESLVWQGIVLPESPFSTDSLTVSIQPSCAITCINICACIKPPKHWQPYHCLDTRKYCTHW